MTSTEPLFWAAGLSSLRLDGAARRSDWHRWEEAHSLERSGDCAQSEIGFAHDLDLLTEHNIANARITLDWARIEPWAGRHDYGALEHYESRLIEARDAGISIFATLHHGSLPGWFSEDTDGFTTRNGPSIHWSRHVDAMAERFDDLVTAWIPIEDPIGWAMRGHHFGERPPGRTSTDKRQDATSGAVDALFEAHRLLASGSTPIIGSFGLPLLRDADAPAEHIHYWDAVYWRSWSRALTEGVLEWPWQPAVERHDLAGAFDAVAVRVAPPMSVAPTGALWPWPASSEVRTDRTGFRPNAQALGEVLHRVDELVDHDLIVTGLGLEHTDDEWRSELLEAWLDQIFRARHDGVKIRGLVLEPFIDGYSEAAGSFLENGLFSRDREPKASFRWIEAQR